MMTPMMPCDYNLPRLDGTFTQYEQQEVLDGTCCTRMRACDVSEGLMKPPQQQW